MSKRGTSSEKWVLTKLDEQDKQIREIMQLIKDLKIEIERLKTEFVVEALSAFVQTAELQEEELE